MALKGRRLADAGIGNNLWPELPRQEATDLIKTGEDFQIDDCTFLKGEDEREFVVMKCIDGEGQQFTTAGGGVITDKMHQAKEASAFPLIVKMVVKKSKKNRDYHDFE